VNSEVLSKFLNIGKINKHVCNVENSYCFSVLYISTQKRRM